MNDEPPPSLGEYAVHTAWEGFASIVHRSSGEVMHSRTPPMVEAQRVYVEQADLAALLTLPERSDTLVLWDVGLGAAANAMAAIHCYEAGAMRPMHIVSFENDLDSLRLALANDERFSYLQHSGPRELLRAGRWEHAGLSWELVVGDFVETMSSMAAAPEVIFYDMFSPKTCEGAWQFATFRKLFAICGAGATTLCTYTRSTAARAMMLAAGFWVARGRQAGAKEETTVAFTPTAVGKQHELLGAEWLAKWERSAAKFPPDLPLEEREAFERTIREHPQFAV